MGGISVLFFVSIFYLLIACLMAYERGWIGGALCLYIYMVDIHGRYIYVKLLMMVA